MDRYIGRYIQGQGFRYLNRKGSDRELDTYIGMGGPAEDKWWTDEREREKNQETPGGLVPIPTNTYIFFQSLTPSHSTFHIPPYVSSCHCTTPRNASPSSPIRVGHMDAIAYACIGRNVSRIAPHGASDQFYQTHSAGSKRC